MTAPVASAALASPFTAPDALTERSFRIWSAGAYDHISAGFRREAAAFVARQRITDADRVLDVACGSGNTTIPAALTGADVTGIDLVPSLLELAGAWARREAISVRLDVGTAEALPYADASFDVVLSMFGVMFAARPERVVSELARVTRRGGRVVLGNWTRDGFIGQLLGIHGKFAPPPADVPSPLLWGDESVIRERFPASEWDVRMVRYILTFRYPTDGAGIARLFQESYGPTVRAFEAVPDAQRPLFAKALEAHWQQHAIDTQAGSEVDSTYLRVVAVRR